MTEEHDRKKECQCRKGPDFSRRSFLTSVGAGAVAAAVSGPLIRQEARAEPGPVMTGEEMVKITMQINGRPVRLLVEPRWSLLSVLRDQLGLTGTKEGCERGECGACTVLIGDLPRYSCLTLAVEADGAAITTVEGLMRGEELGPMQQAFLEEDAYQCGYCTPGQIMAAEGLLRANPQPSLPEIQHGMSGNLCRCGAYRHIFKAVQKRGKVK